VGLPTDEHGLRIDALEDALQRQRPALLYTVPTHQNPSGATLPLDRRRRLLELSQQHGFLVLADEVYHCLSYGEQPPATPGQLLGPRRGLVAGVLLQDPGAGAAPGLDPGAR
jgi:2-aminoadipate transaminase